MSEWAWVFVGYATTAVAVCAHLMVLLRRRSALRRRRTDVSR